MRDDTRRFQVTLQNDVFGLNDGICVMVTRQRNQSQREYSPTAGLHDLGPGSVAAGTMARKNHVAMPSPARRVWLTIEMILLFLGLPIAAIIVITTFSVPLFVVLQPVFITFVLVLLLDRSFLLREELVRGFQRRDALSIFAVFLIVGGILAAIVAEQMPDRFLSFPRQRTEIWQLVMVLYPILSVIVQELVYRTFFFHRYGPLFGPHRWALVLMNGLLFGFAHIIFANWIAVAGTAVAGMLFAYRYEQTRSFWAVWLEHTLWGWFVFTVGLGGFFFTGNSNFRF